MPPFVTYVNYAGLAPLRWQSYVHGIVAPELMGNMWLGRMAAKAQELREEVADWLGCETSQVAFLPNTSVALTVAANSVLWQPGETALYPAQDFPANIFPWTKLQERVGVQSIGVESWQDFLQDPTPQNVKMVSLSTVDFTTGIEQPWQNVVRHAHASGIWTCVDAIQSAGVKPAYLPEIDFWCCGTQKWLVSGLGLAVMVVSKRVLSELSPPFPAWLALNELSVYSSGLKKDTAQAWETGWVTPAAIQRFLANLRFFKKTGWETVTASVKARRDYLHEQLLEMDWPVVSDPVRWSGIVSLDPGVENVEKIVQDGYKHRIVTVKRGPYVRLSPHMFNSMGQLKKVSQWLWQCRVQFR